MGLKLKLSKEYCLKQIEKNKDVSLNYRYLWYNLLAYRQDKITEHIVFLCCNYMYIKKKLESAAGAIFLRGFKGFESPGLSPDSGNTKSIFGEFGCQKI